MPYEGLGARHDATATKVCQHGQIVVEDNVVGTAFKNMQLRPFVDPLATDNGGRLLAQQIAVDEPFEIQIGGVHEAPAIDELEALDVSDLVYIRASDNKLLPAPTSGGTNEVQTITLTSATGGTVGVSFEGDEVQVPFDATGAAVQALLEGLADIEPGDVTVTGAAGGPWVVTFGGRYADEDVPDIALDASTLVGSGHAAADAETTKGVAGAGSLPVGVVTEVDVTRDPAFLRINSNAWQAFLPGAPEL